MTEDEARQALAEALHGSLCSCEEVDAGTGFLIRDADVDKAMDALLPVVRHLVAEELRAAAAAITADGRPDLTTVDQVQVVNDAAQWLDARAAALDTPDHGKA